MQQPKVTFHIRLKNKEFTNIPDAERTINKVLSLYPGMPNLEVSYHMPQPTYKKWVPGWLIKWVCA